MDYVLTLHIEVPNNLRHQHVFDYENVPCVCKVDGNDFSIAIAAPLPVMAGVIRGWDRASLEMRASAMGGSSVTFHCPGLITAIRSGTNTFFVKALRFFMVEHPGWMPIIEDGQWAEPVDRMTPEQRRILEEIEADCAARSIRKKRKGSRLL